MHHLAVLAWQQTTLSEPRAGPVQIQNAPPITIAWSPRKLIQYVSQDDDRAEKTSTRTALCDNDPSAQSSLRDLSAAGTCQTIDHAVQNANAAKPPPQANNRALNLAMDQSVALRLPTRALGVRSVCERRE